MPAIKEFVLYSDSDARDGAAFGQSWHEVDVKVRSSVYAYRRNIVGERTDGFANGAFAGIGEYWRNDADPCLKAETVPAIPGVSSAASVHFLAEEFIIKEGCGPVKFMSILRRRPGMSAAAFSSAWRIRHPLIVRSVPEVWGNFRGYRQNHVLPGRCRHLNGEEMARPIGGIVEIWFDSTETLRATMMSERYKEVIRPDEETFVDLPNTRLFVSEQIVIAD